MPYEFQFRFWDPPALVLSVAGLVLGIRLAYYGRIAQAGWRRVVEAIVVAVLTAVISAGVLAVVRPPLQPQIAAAIGVGCGFLAYLISARYQSHLFGLAGGLILSAATFTAVWFVASLTYIHIAWVLIVLVPLAFNYGYDVGIRAHKYLVIVTTVWAGAGWVSISAIGLLRILLDDSFEHLRDRLLSYVLPVLADVLSVLGILFSTEELALFVLGAVIFVAVLGTGGWNQQRNFQAGSPKINDLTEWLRKAVTNKKVYLLLAGGALVYASLFVAVRVYNLGGLNCP